MLSYEDLLHHLFVAGQTGVGKSSFLAGLALRAIGQGISVCVVEPHSQLIEAIVRRLPEEQLRKCVLIDLTEAEFPVGLSLFDPPNPPTPVNMAEAATLAYAVFSSLWELEAASAPRLLHVLRALTYTLLENNATLAESLLLFSSDTVRANMVAKLTSPEAIAFWQDYNARSGREKRELTDSLTNKIGSFLALPMVRNMVGQASTLDFQELMDSGKIHIPPLLVVAL
jgi:hypothetical protein